MPRTRFTTACLSTLGSIAVIAADAHAADDRAHVSAEFRACMEQNADRSTWRPAEPERIPPS